MTDPATIQTVIVDLDRTLLHTDKTLSPYTVDVFNACRSRGIRVMVATARPLRTAIDYCERIGAEAVTVSNGAKVFCGGLQAEYGIRRESAVDLLNALRKYPSALVTLETGEVAYSNKPIEDYETVLSDDLVGIAARETTIKILVRLDDPQTLAMVTEHLTEDLYLTVANGHLIQIMDRSATKWNGIQSMLALYGCDPATAAYFGDDFDDIEPLQKCGLGIAVANGIPEAKASADCIAESNDQDGVAKFIALRILTDGE